MDGSEVRIKVQTEKLVATSTKVNGSITKCRNSFEQMDSVLRGTSRYWEGEGHSSALKAYTSRADDIERVFNTIAKHVQDLNVIAGTYEDVEGFATEMSNILLGDIIFQEEVWDS